ncbi:MAG: hypothetical protein AB4041_14145 [Microcystaceae cyanobacterium]
MVSLVALSPLTPLSTQFSPHISSLSISSILLDNAQSDINFFPFLAVNFNLPQSKPSINFSQSSWTPSTLLPRTNLPKVEANSLSFFSISRLLSQKNESSQQIADTTHQDVQKRNENIIPTDEAETMNLTRSHQLLNDTEDFQYLDQLANLGLIQPSQPKPEYSPSFLLDVIPLGTIILLGLAGASYGIMRQYSHHPQWHLDLWRKFQAFIGKPQETVSYKTIDLHDEAMAKLTKINHSGSRLESQRFDQQDFIHLSLLHIQVMKDTGDYQGIAESAKHFQTIMAIKKREEKMSYIELNHHGSIQQNFYQYWSKLLESTIDIKQIRKHIQQQLTDYLPKVQTEEGKASLQKYVKLIYQLLEFPYQPFSLRLYQSLQNTDGIEYQALSTITTSLADLSDAEMTNLKSLTCFVIANRDIFDLIGKQINLPKQYQQPQTYAKILQYYAMSDRYQASLVIFDQLLETLEQWYEPYQVVKGIRMEYPACEYQQPPSFQRKIPGLALYLKYKNRLSNPNTGSDYLGFE